MRVLSARWVRDPDGFPLLRAKIRLKNKMHEAIIDTEQKWIRRGFPVVDLGFEWANKVPAIRMPLAEGEEGSLTIRGATKSAVLVAVVRRVLVIVNTPGSEPGNIPVGS